MNERRSSGSQIITSDTFASRVIVHRHRHLLLLLLVIMVVMMVWSVAGDDGVNDETHQFFDVFNRRARRAWRHTTAGRIVATVNQQRRRQVNDIGCGVLFHLTCYLFKKNWTTNLIMLTPNWNCELCVYRCKLNEAEDFCTTIAWRCWRSSWNRHVCHRFYYYRRRRSTTKPRTIRESQGYLESSSFVFLKKKEKRTCRTLGRENTENGGENLFSL